MNELEKRSFYSFLALYVISSSLLISLVAYLYFDSQKRSMETQLHYRLEHIADKESSKIIYAHMNGYMFKYIPPKEDVSVSMIDSSGSVVFGEDPGRFATYKPGYYQVDGLSILVSDATRGHLGVDRVVITSRSLSRDTARLKTNILTMFSVVMLLVIVIAWILSWIFLQPIRRRVAQIERFVNDITHELNTPITSLGMATQQALRSGKCNTKTLNNISISTRQLHDIHRSLVYLNFSHEKDTNELTDLSKTLEDSIEYYRPLAEMKSMRFDVSILPLSYMMPRSTASLLFGNLIGNAIKYSPARSTIFIRLENGKFTILDEGTGIDKDKQKFIFEKYKRGTHLSGGFGVGLNIVRSICQEYHIEIEFDSSLGAGTRFVLKFSDYMIVRK